jgi:hypothetical protein
MYTLLCTTLIFSAAMGVAKGIVPETSRLGTEDQPTFVRHFWSTSDKHHYKLSEGGEVAELVLDQKAGKSD